MPLNPDPQSVARFQRQAREAEERRRRTPIEPTNSQIDADIFRDIPEVVHQEYPRILETDFSQIEARILATVGIEDGLLYGRNNAAQRPSSTYIAQQLAQQSTWTFNRELIPTRDTYPYFETEQYIDLTTEEDIRPMPRTAVRPAEVEEVAPPLEKGELLVLNAKRTDSGISIYVHSPAIADWIKGQSREDSFLDGNTLGHSYARGRKFYKLKRECSYITAPHDFTRNADYSSWLLLDTKLGEGVTFSIEGMIPRDTADKIMANIRKSAIGIYKSFVSPYTVSVKVLINEVV